MVPKGSDGGNAAEPESALEEPNAEVVIHDGYTINECTGRLLLTLTVFVPERYDLHYYINNPVYTESDSPGSSTTPHTDSTLLQAFTKLP